MLSSRALAAPLLCIAFGSWLTLAVACGPESSTEPDTTRIVDASPPRDAAAKLDAAARAPDGAARPTADAGRDSSRPDGGSDARADARDPNEILGTISGACGTIMPLLRSATPSIVDNNLVFAAGESYAAPSLSPGGQKIFTTPNAGGSSVESEVMSFEVLHFCEGATLIKTESEITYNAGSGSITDILVGINGERFGVSVTRVYKPSPGMNDAEIKALLQKKLADILESSARVVAADKWVKQILHVFSPNAAATAAIARVWPTLDAAVKADTIVYVTTTKGGGFIYCNPDPAVGSECPL